MNDPTAPFTIPDDMQQLASAFEAQWHDVQRRCITAQSVATWHSDRVHDTMTEADAAAVRAAERKIMAWAKNLKANLQMPKFLNTRAAHWPVIPLPAIRHTEMLPALTDMNLPGGSWRAHIDINLLPGGPLLVVDCWFDDCRVDRAKHTDGTDLTLIVHPTLVRTIADQIDLGTYDQCLCDGLRDLPRIIMNL